MIPGWYNISVNRDPHSALPGGSRAFPGLSNRPLLRYTSLPAQAGPRSSASVQYPSPSPSTPNTQSACSVPFLFNHLQTPNLHLLCFQKNTNCQGVYSRLPSYPPRARSHNSFRMNTCKSVSKQTTLSIFRMNTYEKTGGRGAPSSPNSAFYSLLSPFPALFYSVSFPDRPNSFPHTPLADPPTLNPYGSHLYKFIGGEGSGHSGEAGGAKRKRLLFVVAGL